MNVCKHPLNRQRHCRGCHRHRGRLCPNRCRRHHCHGPLVADGMPPEESVRNNSRLMKQKQSSHMQSHTDTNIH